MRDAKLRFTITPPGAPDSLPIALPLRGTGWTVTMYIPTAEARRTAIYAAGAAGLGMLLLTADARVKAYPGPIRAV